MPFWNELKNFFLEAMSFLHGLFDGLVGDQAAWGFAIIALTLIVRVLMLPLAVKQTRSMRAMQELQPKMKAIQKKYKPDRKLLRQDPEKYKAMRQKMNQEMQALYQEAGANPLGGCLPLLLQMPFFFAIFFVLAREVPEQIGDKLALLRTSDFYVFTPECSQEAIDGITEVGQYANLDCGLATSASSAGIWGIALILLMAGSMFFAQRQMMARSMAEGTQAQQQKIMMYVMPVFLAAISFNFPVGVLLYWATTNIWQVAQQWIILKEVQHATEKAKQERRTKKTGGSGSKEASRPSKPAKPAAPESEESPAEGNGKRNSPELPSNGKSTPKPSDHLPSKRRRDK